MPLYSCFPPVFLKQTVELNCCFKKTEAKQLARQGWQLNSTICFKKMEAKQLARQGFRPPIRRATTFALSSFLHPSSMMCGVWFFSIVAKSSQFFINLFYTHLHDQKILFICLKAENNKNYCKLAFYGNGVVENSPTITKMIQ